MSGDRPVGIWNIARAQPDREALVTPDHESFTAGDLAERSHRLVHGLRDLGLDVGSVVATLLPNGIEWLEVLLAIQEAGMYVVPVNWHLAASEIAYIVDDSDAEAFIVDERFAATARDAAAAIALPDGRRFAIGDVAGFRDYAEISSEQPAAVPEDRTAGQIMTYTSGTTGRPKGVKRSLSGLDPDTQAELGTFLNNLFGMEDPDHVHLVVAPLYHTAVANFAQAALHAGHRVVLMDEWTPEGTLERIERYGVTSSHMVPTMFHRLLNLPEEVRTSYDVSSLSHMIHSAAPCPVPTKRAMLDWWGPVLYEYYAATEGGGTIATPEDWEKKPGTVGKPWPISEIKILDDDGNELPPGEVGTVWMKMGDYDFEYHEAPDKTKEAWNERGFFTVGDMGELDEDGFLFLRDRKTDMIISGGVNIYPAEIEGVLQQHPDVLDCAVFGVPDEDWGEQVKAAVELTGDAKPSDDEEQELIAFCRDRLGGYKVPRSIDFHDELPRSATGKLHKRKLRDPYWEDRESAIV